ncbi:MAG: O-antigen ligase family protein [Pyrinomonadaceae bacterium]
MTTSISNASASPALPEEVRAVTAAKALTRETTKRRHSLASRLAFLTICVMIVLTTLAYGTVHYWALGVFALTAAGIVVLWCVDGMVLRSVQISLNSLQIPLLGLIILGLIQLLPLGSTPNNGGLSLSLSRSLSLDPYSTRLVLVQLTSLFIFFMATLVFTDSPRRLRTLVRTITIFGFLLAMFGLTQSFTTDGSRVYWFRQLTQSTAFGPFINRHHFAGFMEMAVALPLGLLFSGSIESHKRPLYAFAVTLMGVSLILTNSRGGIISLVAEILFLVVVAGPGLRRGESTQGQRLRVILIRSSLAVGLIVVLFVGVLAVGGADVFGRLLGTVNSADPTTGRTHFWSVTVDVIKAHPVIGSGLGSFGVIYTRYDSRNGMFRLEQAHNDYLQIISDAGVVGGLLGLGFLIILFRKGFARRDTGDKFRSGVATGALAGCFAILVHSAFDFTLHTTANALLFLILAAMATLDRRVDESGGQRRRRRRRSTSGADAQPI